MSRGKTALNILTCHGRKTSGSTSTIPVAEFHLDVSVSRYERYQDLGIEAAMTHFIIYTCVSPIGLCKYLTRNQIQ